MEEFAMPKRPVHGRQVFQEPHSLPDIDIGEEGMTDLDLDMETDSFEEFLTTSDAANLCGVTRFTIRNWIIEKKLNLSDDFPIVRAQLFTHRNPCRFENHIILIQTIKIISSSDRINKTRSLKMFIDVENTKIFELDILIHKKIKCRFPFQSKPQDSDILIFEISEFHANTI
jgi:hypothetical protein